MKTLIRTIYIVIILGFTSCESIANKDWNEYSDTLFHFSIDYKKNWAEITTDRIMDAEEIKLRKERGTLFFSQEHKLYGITFSDKVVPRLQISVYSNSSNSEIHEFLFKIISAQTYSKEDIEFTSLKVGDNKFICATYKNKIGGFTGIYSRYFLVDNEYVYDIFLLTDTDGTYENVNNQIVKSFKLNKK